MKFAKLLIPIFTLAIVIFLNNSWDVGTRIPPFGKFLDPFRGFWRNGERGRKDFSKLLPGLKGEVRVLYDSTLIPHIEAANDEDLCFAQGFITAQDRLWQMEFQVLAGAGRISEIVGKKALDHDRTQRRLGIVFGAQNSLHSMEQDATCKKVLDAYTAGVNAYIKSLSGKDFPIEYKLLDYKPELWTNLKTTILLKVMAQTLNMGDKDLEMTHALKLWGADMVNFLYPDWENVSDPIVDNPGAWKFDAVNKRDTTALALPDDFIHVPPHVKPSPDNGSNNWAVSGKKTATGSPLLCNDPHLNLTLPSLWYIIHLHTPQMNVMGSSIPGAPGVIIGFNDSIAWGVTNAQRDLCDYYKIKFKDKNRNEYWSDGTWKKSVKVLEKFRIRGDETFSDTLVYTHQGPVTYDPNFHHSGKENIAFRWIAHDASREVLAFYKLNRAHSFDDYLQALKFYESPAQNFAFASVSGDIAMRIQGKFPARRKYEGKFLLDGTRTSQEWQYFIPPEHAIGYKNPSRGFVSSANQYPCDTTYPYYITATSYEAYRNRRINQRLGEMNTIKPEDMMGLQNDNFNLKASECLPTWLAMLDNTHFSGDEKAAFQKLNSWNFYNDIDSEGATFFDVWWKEAYAMIWDEMEAESIDFPTDYETIKWIKENPAFLFFDNKKTAEVETAPVIVRKSFSTAVAKLKDKKNQLRWADYKDTFIGHLLQGLPAFSYHVQHGGNRQIVNATKRTHGPSWRMVVSLEKDVRAWGTYPGGQSGNPGSPYYNTFLQDWANGKYTQLKFYGNNQHTISQPLQTIILKPQL